MNTVSTPRQLVYQTLEMKNPCRVPRQLWALPWADIHHPGGVEAIIRDFPMDLGGVDDGAREHPPTRGERYSVGEFTDEWGARFINREAGIHGEVKEPVILRDDWADAAAIRTPEQWLTIDPVFINRQCAASDLFILGGCCPRPFEQMQFLRGTQQLLMDLMDPPPAMLHFMARMHDFYCRQMRAWAATDVDGLNFMDDWGSQRSLLIPPRLWDKYFRPMYQDYIDIAHSAGKKIFMHSDGYTLEILPRLIDMGLDAFNTQIFCIGLPQLQPYKGRITFWGEIDRQHILPEWTKDQVCGAVRQVFDTLWAGGGCIAQCEFGAGARPDNVRAVYETWQQMLPGC